MKDMFPQHWEDFEWPEWVPARVRQQIEDFWAERYGRSPGEWYKSTVGDMYHKHPQLGTRVKCESIGGDQTFEGRWVPAWNNIGRVVLDDGTYEVSSTVALVEI